MVIEITWRHLQVRLEVPLEERRLARHPTRVVHHEMTRVVVRDPREYV